VAQLRANFRLPEGAVLALGTGVSEVHNARHRLLRNRPMFVVCTYSTATLQGAPDSPVALLRVLPYGLLILDEAQTAVAKCFRRALEIPCASVLAISATFMRQDGCIELLQQQVGPLLVDVPRALLVPGDFIADVSRVELHVSGPGPGGDAALHPHKVVALLSLLEHHLLSEGDKVVVFCDWLQHVAAVHRLLFDHVRGRAPVLGPVMMHTPAGQRQAHLEAFRRAGRVVLCLLRVADSAVDLPSANVLVQVSCSGWHRQRMRRAGRVRRSCSAGWPGVQWAGRGSPLTARPCPGAGELLHRVPEPGDAAHGSRAAAGARRRACRVHVGVARHQGDVQRREPTGVYGRGGVPHADGDCHGHPCRPRHGGNPSAGGV